MVQSDLTVSHGKLATQPRNTIQRVIRLHHRPRRRVAARPARGGSGWCRRTVPASPPEPGKHEVARAAGLAKE